jgi:ribonuclease HII
MKIEDIKEIFRNTKETDLKNILAEYESDERPGVQKLVAQYQRKLDNYEKELVRIEEMRIYEKKYSDAVYICGIDEVGRGPLAGPVVTCAVILPKDCRILYVNDSKKLSEKKREELYDVILREALDVSIGIESPETIDEINILQATYRAMRQSVQGLKYQPDVIFVDAVRIPEIPYHQVPIIKGDAKSITIAAASIVAKVTRDRMMVEYDKLYPEYDFASNKGYGTEKHIQALKKIGPSPIHRRTFIQNFC